MKKWFWGLLVGGFVFFILPLMFVMITGITLSETLAGVLMSLSMLCFEACALLKLHENRSAGKSIFTPLMFAIANVLVFAGTIGKLVL